MLLFEQRRVVVDLGCREQSAGRASAEAGSPIGGCCSVPGWVMVGLYQPDREEREKQFQELFAVRIVSGSLVPTLVLINVCRLTALAGQDFYVTKVYRAVGEASSWQPVPALGRWAGPWLEPPDPSLHR